MATDVHGRQTRDLVTAQTHYLRKRILGSQGAGVRSLGILPAGANVVGVVVSTRVVLNGTPTVSVGTAGTPAGYLAAAANGLTAVGTTRGTLAAANASQVPDVATEVIATIGGTPTTGTADVQVEYTIEG